MPSPSPIRDRQVRHSREGRKSFRRGQRAIAVLQIHGKLPGLGLGHDQVGAAIAVEVRPQHAALGFFGSGQRQHLELTLPEGSRQRLRGLARELRNGRAPGILGNRHDVRAFVGFEVVRQVRTDRRHREINLRAEFPFRVLQSKTERRRTVPVHQQQVVAAIAVHVQHLHCLDASGKRNPHRLRQRVIGPLREQINAIFPEQHQVGAVITIQIAGRQRIGLELPVIDGPALGRAPGVRSLVVKHHQFLVRLAVIGDVRPSVAVQVRHDERRNAFFRGNGFNAEPRVRRQIIHLALDFLHGGFFEVGLASLIVEQINFRLGIVDHDQIVQAVAVEVGRAEQADLAIERIFLLAGEAKAVRIGVLGLNGGRQGQGKNGRKGPRHLSNNDPKIDLHRSRKVPVGLRVGQFIHR